MATANTGSEFFVFDGLDGSTRQLTVVMVFVVGPLPESLPDKKRRKRSGSLLDDAEKDHRTSFLNGSRRFTGRLLAGGQNRAASAHGLFANTSTILGRWPLDVLYTGTTTWDPGVVCKDT